MRSRMAVRLDSFSTSANIKQSSAKRTAEPDGDAKPEEFLFVMTFCGDEDADDDVVAGLEERGWKKFCIRLELAAGFVLDGVGVVLGVGWCVL